MRRLLPPIALYALVAVLALAAPIAISEEAPTAPTDTTAAPAPAAPEAAPTTTEAAPAPAEPAPAAQPAPVPTTAAPAPAPAAPADPAAAAAQPVIEDDAPVDKPKKTTIAKAAASTGVTISDFKFSPGGVTVNVGDTVSWSNQGPTPHSATANDGSFDTGILDKGGSGSHTFSQAGTFSYYCKPHPFMKGTVTVVAAAVDNGGSGSDTASGVTSGADATADAGSGLPSTGLDLGGIAALGLMTLAMGAYLRRRTAVEPARPAGRIGW